MTPDASIGFERATFVDSSGFFAVTNESDKHHRTARTIFARAVADGVSLVTTTFIVAEAHALFLSRAGYSPARAFLTNVDSSGITIIRPLLRDELRAREIIFRYRDKTFSFTDALSFAVMERLGISVAFTFDSDFRQYGFAAAQG